MSERKGERERSINRRQVALAFGGALRLLRTGRGVSQVSLAVSSDLDPTFISMIERGRRVPSSFVIIRLADALKVDPVRLFAEGIARLPEITSIGPHAVYRLAYRRPDGRLVEAEGTYSDCVDAIRSAALQNGVRGKSGAPELTHMVEYIRTDVAELSGQSS